MSSVFRLPSTSVDTAISASSWTPPEPAVLWNILRRDAITTSEICSASWCCTFRRTFCRDRKRSALLHNKSGSDRARAASLTCRVAQSSDCRSLNWIRSEVLWM